ncbi:Hypothetical protein A7982_07997 [Minicystis rosea]|nr:Hypothetical protein A7982_07997 [Minicystis rosea]
MVDARRAHAIDPAPGDDAPAAESCDRSRIGSLVQMLEEQVIRFRAAGGAPPREERDRGERDLIEAAREVARLAEGASTCEALRTAVGQVEYQLDSLDINYRQWLGFFRRLGDTRQDRMEHEFQQIEALVHHLRRAVGGLPTPPRLRPFEPIPVSCDRDEISRHARGMGDQALRVSAALRGMAGFEQTATKVERIAALVHQVGQLARAAASCDEIRFAVGGVERSFYTFEWQVGLGGGPPAPIKGDIEQLDAMVGRLRRLVGGRPVSAAP